MCIVGPTASGKTSLAVALALQYQGEVVSADSRQIYRGLDVGTEKVTVEEMQGVPHHCIDIASPRRAFSVEQWKRRAERAVRGIVRRGNLPIVAGGTGQYLDALVYNQSFPAVPPNSTLRTRLARRSTTELYAQLQKLDPERARTVDKFNPRRLIRAIEIADALGSVPKLQRTEAVYTTLWIGLNPGIEQLTERINARLDDTLTQGLVQETQMLRDMHLSWNRIDELGLEYRSAAAYLRGKLSAVDMRTRMQLDLRQYAKRQLRWFKRNKEIHWYTDPDAAFAACEEHSLLSSMS